jgi:hypothetical protein
MKYKTLQQRVMDEVGDELSLPSSTKTQLKFCSDKLSRIKTEEDFDMILQSYSLLDNQLKRAGLSTTDFKEIIEKMKEDMKRQYNW